MQSIAVIDYGMGNLRSVVNALEHVAGKKHRVELTSDPGQVMQADRVVFPGQGAAGDCMRAIDEYELRETLIEAANSRPFLGICMGLQVLIEHSEENQGTDCLGLYAGQVRYFGDGHHDADGERLKVPHMGWNELSVGDHPVLAGIETGDHAYFVHSYHLRPRNPEQRLAHTAYGEMVAAVVGRGNMVGTQFHPEKSQLHGLAMLRNFLEKA